MSTPNMSIIILFSDQDTKDVFNPTPFCQILMRSPYIHFVEPKDPGMELSFRFNVWFDARKAIIHEVADTFMSAIQHNRSIDVFLAAYQEKNHVAPPSSQDEALSRYSASGEVPR